MDKNILKKIMQDQHEVIKSINIVDRDIMFEQEANYILVGVRRAGKSWLLYKRVKDLIKKGISWDQIIYINFDDERLSLFSADDFGLILDVAAELTTKKKYFYFDEIQNIDGWEKFVRRMADQKYKVDITGSNAKMLSNEMNAKLGGRYISKVIHPYSFIEYLRSKKIDLNNKSSVNQGKINKCFDDFLTFGGFPECINFNNKREYITSIFEKILLGDIVLHNNIRNTNGAKVLIHKIAETLTNSVSYTRLHDCVNSIGHTLSKEMVINYCNYCKDSFLIFTIKNYYDSFSERESKPKYYFQDNGLLNILIDDKKTSLLENCVACYLNNKYKDELSFIKSSKTGLDIDFYLAKQKKVFQVCYNLSSTSYDREIKQLIKFAKIIKQEHEYFIITYSEKKKIQIDGIIINVIPAVELLTK